MHTDGYETRSKFAQFAGLTFCRYMHYAWQNALEWHFQLKAHVFHVGEQKKHSPLQPDAIRGVSVIPAPATKLQTYLLNLFHFNFRRKNSKTSWDAGLIPSQDPTLFDTLNVEMTPRPSAFPQRKYWLRLFTEKNKCPIDLSFNYVQIWSNENHYESNLDMTFNWTSLFSRKSFLCDGAQPCAFQIRVLTFLTDG